MDAVRNYLTRANFSSVLGADMLKPLLHYRPMIQEREPTFFDSFMKASDPKAVVEYDRMVAAFNADIPRIKKENDVGTIKSTVEKLLNIALGNTN